MIKAAVYLRATKAEIAQGLPTISEQLARLMAYAKEERLEIFATYEDDSVGSIASYSRLGDFCSRSGLTALLDDADAAPWLFVLVDSLPVIERRDVDLDPVKELEKFHKVVATVGTRLYLSMDLTPKKVDRFRKKKTLTVAERLLRGRENGAREGKHQSGPAPFGYRRLYTPCPGRSHPIVTLEIEPEEAGLVKKIYREYLRRKSMKLLIEHLAKEGHTTRKGKQWSRAGVAWILKNETYLGRVHFGKIRAKGKHPAIISPIIFNRVQKLIRKNNKRGGKSVLGHRRGTA